MGDIAILIIAASLLWIGWELHRVARLATIWVDELERLAQESERQKTSSVPAPEHRIPNPDMTGWESAQKSQNP
jgi:hypothetical protein